MEDDLEPLFEDIHPDLFVPASESMAIFIRNWQKSPKAYGRYISCMFMTYFALLDKEGKEEALMHINMLLSLIKDQFEDLKDIQSFIEPYSDEDG